MAHTKELESLDDTISKRKLEIKCQEDMRLKIEKAVANCAASHEFPSLCYPKYIAGLLVEQKFDRASALKLLDAKLLRDMVGSQLSASIVDSIKMSCL